MARPARWARCPLVANAGKWGLTMSEGRRTLEHVFELLGTSVWVVGKAVQVVE